MASVHRGQVTISFGLLLFMYHLCALLFLDQYRWQAARGCPSRVCVCVCNQHNDLISKSVIVLQTLLLWPNSTVLLQADKNGFNSTVFTVVVHFTESYKNTQLLLNDLKRRQCKWAAGALGPGRTWIWAGETVANEHFKIILKKNVAASRSVVTSYRIVPRVMNSLIWINHHVQTKCCVITCTALKEWLEPLQRRARGATASQTNIS